jgi:hypothetical protein
MSIIAQSRAKAARKSTKKPASKKAAANPPSVYERGMKNGWGFLIETSTPGHLRKLKEMT